MDNLSESNQNVKKPFLNVISENIPAELKTIPQWVNWKGFWQPDKDKWDKVPFQPDGSYAKTNDPSTWYPFETVASRNGQFDGIGFVLNKQCGIAGFDFDHCIENNVISPEVQTIIDTLNSYTEKSPSGTGIRIFCFGKLPAGIRKNTERGYECYDSGRYLTLTGHHIEGTPLTVEKRKNEIRQVHSEYFKKPEKPPFPHPPPVISTPLSTQELLEKAFQSAGGDKIQRLFSGNWSDYPSQSEADLALCQHLSFWFDRNESDIDSVFRQSGLFRDKWDTKHRADGATYGQITISKAVANTSESYQQHFKSSEPPIILSKSGLTSQQILALLYEQELGDSTLFATLHHNNLLFDNTEKEWYIWQKHFWKNDETNYAASCIQDLIDCYADEASKQSRLQIEASKQGEQEKAKKYKRHYEALLARINALRFLKRRKSVFKLATELRGNPLVISGREWDSKPYTLPCKNGVVDLKTGEVREGKPKDYIRTHVPHEWKGLNQECPNWEKFLSEILNNDAEMVSFVKRLLGYAITGKVKLHKFPVFWGKGRNGKGTLFETLKYVLGSFVHKTNADTLMEHKKGSQKSPPDADTHALWGKRLVYASETSEGKQFNLSKVKELVGGDTLNARLPFSKRPTEFTPSHLLILMTNERPRVLRNDFAFWERLLLVPFELSFVDRKPKGQYERRADIHLDDKLKKEASGILAWLVQGCLEWQKYGLTPPASVIKATEEYKKEEDVIGQFIDDCCETGNGFEVKAGDLYKAYRAWAESGKEFILSQTKFGMEMKKKFDSYKDTYVKYIGIRLIEKTSY